VISTCQRPTHKAFASSIPFVAEGFHAAAVYCSDGRFSNHFNDFLVNGLGLTNCDRVILPGGPACTAEYPSATVDSNKVLGELHFLIEAHGLDLVVLIQHAGCAHYSVRIGVDGDEMVAQQTIDLKRVAQSIKTASPTTRVEGYFAIPANGSIKFDPANID